MKKVCSRVQNLKDCTEGENPTKLLTYFLFNLDYFCEVQTSRTEND